MDRMVLNNKPLIEAIFELRWGLPLSPRGLKVDPNSGILVGALYEKIKGSYPFYEKLPSADIPSEISQYIPQHRFRTIEGGWPLIQLGQGLITVNSTKEYIWEEFKNRIRESIIALYSVYPEGNKNLVPVSLSLRYIDSLPFDYEKYDILAYLKKYLKLDICLYNKIFEETKIKNAPKGIDIRLGFESTQPEGIMHLRLYRGITHDKDSLVWETVVISTSEIKLPNIPDDIYEWLEKAHDLTDKWFFNLVEGELLEQFK